MNYNNLAQATNFIAGSDKFKNVPFFITGLNIPGININHPEISGGRQGTLMNLSGDSINYNSLSFEMLIDEDFQIYQELMDIVRKNISPTNGTYGDFYFDFFIEINNSKIAREGQHTKMELVYDYLTGPRFRHRVEAIVEKFSDMQADLDRERKAMTRLWAKRETQIQGVIESTVGMYGDLQGIAGQAIQQIEGLEVPLIESNDESD